MLDAKFIRDNQAAVRRAAEQKGVEFDVDEVVALSERVRQLQIKVDEGQRLRRELSNQFRGSDAATRAKLREQAGDNDETLKQDRSELALLRAELTGLLLLAPNIPWEGAPIGAGEVDNVVIREWGQRPTFDFDARDHVELLELRGWAEFERARKAAGDRAYALKAEGVLLERALHSLALDILIDQDFELISVPALVQREALVGTGFLPGHAEEIYYLEQDDLYLAGTAEVGLVGMSSNEVIDLDQLPRRYAGISPCFRREVGSAGRDVRGLLRVHQFEKVEQFVICAADAEESARWHSHLLNTAETILQQLELPYQVVETCTGDMGLGKFRMNDINTWFPSLGIYRETHSCSTLHDWQARRAGIRYRDGAGTVRFAHTLNNTAVATPRLLGALVENHQRSDGSVALPQALRGYLKGRELL
ncbi:MAG: serine--tRNA ligase [Acidimicrobiales bacterium]